MSAGLVCISWLISVYFLYSEWGKRKMRDGHCHSCQHVVIEIAGDVCPQEVLHIIANICLYVHTYESCLNLPGRACGQVFNFVHFWMCICPVGVNQCGGLVYLWGIIWILLFSGLLWMCLWGRYMHKHMHTHSQTDFFLCVSAFLCALLSSMADRLLNIQPNANRTSVRLSVCVCLQLSSKPKRTTQLNNKLKANRGTPSTSELYPLWSHQSWD